MQCFQDALLHKAVWTLTASLGHSGSQLRKEAGNPSVFASEPSVPKHLTWKHWALTTSSFTLDKICCVFCYKPNIGAKKEKSKNPHRTQQFSFNQLQKFYNSFDLAAMCFFFALSVQILEPYFAAVKFSLRRGPST